MRWELRTENVMARAHLHHARQLIIAAILLTVVAGLLAVTAATRVAAQEHDETDPFRSVPLACELLSTTQPPRTARNIEHVANVCGIVGTDVEFQSRADEAGDIHDYAFVGTMGFGFRIFDITDPENPTSAGAYIATTGWQNDIQVRGDIVVSTFDGVSGEPSALSPCLLQKDLNDDFLPNNSQQGVDIFKLNFDPLTALFDVDLIDCVPTPPGGAHNATLHPGGKWLAISNSSSDWAVDFIDLTGVLDTDANTGAVHTIRLIDESRWNLASTFPPATTRCPIGADYACAVLTRPPDDALGSDPESVPCGGPAPVACPADSPYGEESAHSLFRPHDIFFSEGGGMMYVAALQSTVIVDVEALLDGEAPHVNDGTQPTDHPAVSIIPQLTCPADEYAVPGVSQASCGEEAETAGLNNPHNLQLSHQADTTPDGLILAITDERGGGIQETRCQEDPAGVIGGVHFWALGDIGTVGGIDTSAASPAKPVRLGAYFNPNPGLGVDPFQEDVEDLPRAERACTSHVLRFGGNGTASPGEVETGFDGVSDLPDYEMTLGWYGAGIWWLDASGPSDSEDEIAEEPRSTWGNTLGWIVMPGSEAWSGKTYKIVGEGDDARQYIYAGDMVRGFDIYRFAPGVVVEPPPPTPSPSPSATTTASPSGSPSGSPGATTTGSASPGVSGSASPGVSGSASPGATAVRTATPAASRPAGAGLPNTASEGAVGAALAAVLIVASIVLLGGLKLAEIRRRNR